MRIPDCASQCAVFVCQSPCRTVTISKQFVSHPQSLPCPQRAHHLNNPPATHTPTEPLICQPWWTCADAYELHKTFHRLHNYNRHQLPKLYRKMRPLSWIPHGSQSATCMRLTQLPRPQRTWSA